MRIHYIQHVEFEGLGCIQQWISLKGHLVTSTKLYEGEAFPLIEEFDFLIILGGSMGTYEENEYPWLSAEKEFIRLAINTDKIVLGICLGAQLIANALRKKVFPSNVTEIGWMPITVKNLKNKVLSTREKTFFVFQWHSDTFELPEKATRLASSELCINQAFHFNQKVIGLQFHLEITIDSIQQMINFGGKKIANEDAEKLFGTHSMIEQSNQKMVHLLNYLEDIKNVII